MEKEMKESLKLEILRWAAFIFCWSGYLLAAYCVFGDKPMVGRYAVIAVLISSVIAAAVLINEYSRDWYLPVKSLPEANALASTYCRKFPLSLCLLSFGGDEKKFSKQIMESATINSAQAGKNAFFLREKSKTLGKTLKYGDAIGLCVMAFAVSMGAFYVMTRGFHPAEISPSWFSGFSLILGAFFAFIGGLVFGWAAIGVFIVHFYFKVKGET